ncbi:MAG: inositol monophosphatase [Verrucomicrobia bacterium]|nr:inositol monophosphatase [Verrucomicrobiota bacterium]
MKIAIADQIRELLLQLGDHVRNTLHSCNLGQGQTPAFASISRQSVADTIYGIDQISEDAIAAWFADHWPATIPVELVLEGIDPQVPVTFPAGIPVEQTETKIILDPIDGTRGIMYDKRAAWFLAGVAAQRGSSTRLSDIEVAVMVELPTTKQWRADRFSAIRDHGLFSDSVNVLTGDILPRSVTPSLSGDVLHGFGYISRFLPAGKELTAAIEQRLWDRLYLSRRDEEVIVFEDQYISTGGQFSELLLGHDRMIADIRPLVFKKLGIASALCCHPYDVAAGLVLQEAGIILESPDGNPLDGPLDTTSPISWVGYANPKLADHIRPVLRAVLREMLDV